MPSINASKHNTMSPTHQDFRWISGAGLDDPCADFIEMARDVSAGIHSCMQIIYASNLIREENQDAESGQENAPAICITDGDNLFRLSMTSAHFLLQAADERIGWLNRVEDK